MATNNYPIQQNGSQLSNNLLDSYQSFDRTRSSNSVTPLDGTIDPQLLKAKLMFQLEYYFSEVNILKDGYMKSQMDKDQFILIEIIAGFNRVRRLTHNIQLVTDVLREMQGVQLNADGLKVRRVNDSSTLLLPEVPQNTPEEAFYPYCPPQFFSSMYPFPCMGGMGGPFFVDPNTMMVSRHCFAANNVTHSTSLQQQQQRVQLQQLPLFLPLIGYGPTPNNFHKQRKDNHHGVAVTTGWAGCSGGSGGGAYHHNQSSSMGPVPARHYASGMSINNGGGGFHRSHQEASQLPPRFTRQHNQDSSDRDSWSRNTRGGRNNLGNDIRPSECGWHSGRSETGSESSRQATREAYGGDNQGTAAPTAAFNDESAAVNCNSESDSTGAVRKMMEGASIQDGGAHNNGEVPSLSPERNQRFAQQRRDGNGGRFLGRRRNFPKNRSNKPSPPVESSPKAMEAELTAFPPLPGATATPVSCGEVLENKTADVVKALAKDSNLVRWSGPTRIALNSVTSSNLSCNSTNTSPGGQSRCSGSSSVGAVNTPFFRGNSGSEGGSSPVEVGMSSSNSHSLLKVDQETHSPDAVSHEPLGASVAGQTAGPAASESSASPMTSESTADPTTSGPKVGPVVEVNSENPAAGEEMKNNAVEPARMSYAQMALRFKDNRPTQQVAAARRDAEPGSEVTASEAEYRKLPAEEGACATDRSEGGQQAPIEGSWRTRGAFNHEDNAKKGGGFQRHWPQSRRDS